MAGAEWVWIRGSDAEFIGIGDKLEGQIMKAMPGIMAKIIADAVEDAKARSADRVLTGAMISAIEGKVEAGAREVAGKFGFLGEQQDYFIFQTVTGFHHWLGGEFIEPTFALRDAGEVAKGELVAEVAALIGSLKL
jgi:hypothetical protein